MARNRQSDLFREQKPFPKDLFEIGKFEAVKYFKEWYYIFLYHLQTAHDNKKYTDEVSSQIAQELLVNESINKIDDPEARLKQVLEIEISHMMIDYFIERQMKWFQINDFDNSDIRAFLRQRGERAQQIDIAKVSQELRPKIETSITYFELIDEEIAKALKIDLYKTS